MEWFQAQDTFVAELADGSSMRVPKGHQLPANHELVMRDQDPKTGGGQLFAHAYNTEDDKPSPKSEAKADAPAKAAVKAPVKDGKS
jgi:hypothetical protein